MKSQLIWQRRLVYGLVFISGGSGLIYEVIWLTILLGAQARVTGIVLAIFLGGISLGYAAFGKWSKTRGWNLMLAYAAVELMLGFWAFFFPTLFAFVLPRVSWAYHTFGANNIWCDIVFSSLLIGFPTFLMGGTLPLLSQALSGTLEDASETRARIYGFNTVGASFGAVFAGFVSIALTNFSVTSIIAGGLNTIGAFVIYFTLAKKFRAVGVRSSVAGKPPKFENRRIYAIGLLSGFHIITLQTLLTHLMSLSSGSSPYVFSLVVSVFVLGLGFSSLVVRKVVTFRFAHFFWNQVVIGVSLLLLYLTADKWPYAVHLIRIIFRDTAPNFYLDQATLAVFFTAFWIVTIGLCGFTLPLCLHLTKDWKDALGYRVEQLYSLNTPTS